MFHQRALERIFVTATLGFWAFEPAFAQYATSTPDQETFERSANSRVLRVRGEQIVAWIPSGLGDVVRARVQIDGREDELVLKRIDLLTPEFNLLVNGVDRTTDYTEGIQCFRGEWLGEEAGVAFATMTDDYIEAVLRSGSTHRPTESGGSASGSVGQGPSFLQAAFPYVDLALEADVDFFQRFGRSRLSTTVTAMLSMANDIDFLFQREVGVRYRVSFLSVWTSEPDPYYSLDSAELVDGLQDYWTAHRGWVLRDSVHLLSGKVLFNGKFGATPQVGDSYPGYICDVGMAYSVSSAGNLGASLSDQYYNITSNMAHEQGHQWGVGHCSGGDCVLMCGDPSCFEQRYEFEPFTRGVIWSKLPLLGCLEWLPGETGTGAPDLIVSELHIPDEIGLGQSMHAGITVKNVGASTANAKVRIYTWLSLDGDPFFGFDDLPMGGPIKDAKWVSVKVNLAPGQTRTYWFDTWNVPYHAERGLQHFIALVDVGALPCASVCESNESNNLLSHTILVKGVDATVIDIDAPSTALSGSQVVVRATVLNDSAQQLDIPVGVSLCGVFQSQMAFSVAPLEQRVMSFNFSAPPSPGNCGQPDPCAITACANLLFDTVPSNNCRTETIHLIDSYWDLKVEIVSSQSIAYRGSATSWTARWTNVGVVGSPVRSMRTGIMNWSGNATVWNSGIMYNACGNGPLQFYNVPPLGPGQTHVKSFGMCIPWSAQLGDQYLKVGFDEAAGSIDFCHAGANFQQRTIEIR